MENAQLGHYDTLNKMPAANKNHEIVIYACGITPENLGLILRSADIFSANGIIYQGDPLAQNQNKLHKISRGSTTPVRFVEDSTLLSQLKENGCRIVALEITQNSTPLRKATWDASQTILVVGNEKTGVPQDILNMCDATYHIEMTGKNISSMNAAIATSIALSKFTDYQLERDERTTPDHSPSL